MDKITRTSSINLYLSEYLADMRRAGVRDLAFDAPPANQNESAPPRQRAAAPARPTRSDVRSAPPAPAPYPEPERPGAAPPRLAARDCRPAPSGAPDPETEARIVQLQTIAREVAECRLCAELAAGRTQTVFGTGDPRARLLFLGEGPGAEEDLRGEPFVGRSGKLLTDMIEKGMGIPRDSVFICNVVRCRPPGNRNPTDEEATACRPFLEATLNVVKPEFICCLGSIAATNLLGAKTSLGSLRGTIHDYRGMKVVCTYHPAYLLRNPNAKKDAWIDLQLLMKEMGLKTQRR